MSIRKIIESMDWSYVTLVNGRLLDDNGNDLNTNIPDFDTREEAEAYLEDNDIRASIR